MTTLDIEARLDNLLATAQEETNDIDLFASIAEREECPLCMIPQPFQETEITFSMCCGKRICIGCLYKHAYAEMKKGVRPVELKCAFCRQQQPNNDIKALKKLMKKNDPQAFMMMAEIYSSGEGVFQSDTRTLEMCIRAAELGLSNAYADIGNCYRRGVAVKQNTAKALEFYEIAAKKGFTKAHTGLADYHQIDGKNSQMYIKHLKVVASAGHQESMDKITKAYRDELLSKEELSQTLRAFQLSSSEMKSEERDFARRARREM